MPDCETQALLAELEKAECQFHCDLSERLDARIFYHAGCGGDLTHFSARKISGTIPHYTTSIDAKLPGENIIWIIKTDMIVAGHQSEDGRIYVGESKSEALARRVAVLKDRSLRAKEAGG